MSGEHGEACPGRGEEIFLLAAGALEGEERARLHAHLDTGCPRCREDLAGAESLLAGLASTLEPIEPPPAVRARLLARVAEDVPRRRTASAPRRARGLRRPAWAAAAAIGLVVGTGIGALYVDRRVADPLRQASAGRSGQEQAAAEALAARVADLEAERDELAEMLDEQDDELASLEGQLALAQEQLRMFEGDALMRVALQGTGPLADVDARMFWEWKDEYTCYLHVRSLPPPPAGRAQVLWLEDEKGQFIRVGVLVRDEGGEATVFAKLPQEERAVVRALVSEEEAAPGPEPRGAVLLSAEL